MTDEKILLFTALAAILLVLLIFAFVPSSGC